MGSWKIRISVITVCFNSVDTIKETLNSIAEQNHDDIEHLIIDGVSNDGTLEILRCHATHKFTLISEPDKGIYDAMNKGLSRASGDVIGFLNSDDSYTDKHSLSKIAQIFLDESVDACYADLVYIEKTNQNIIRYWKSKDFLPGDFARGWCPAHPTFYVRKSAIDRLGFFDLTYKGANDVEFMMRYLEVGKINVVYIPQILVHMKIGGVSNSSFKNIVLQNIEIINALKNHDIPFSRLSFLINKLISRLIQFFGRTQKL